ncbi:hypothetical protein [Ilumatobacter coccineus]|jgi:hypothetical protein|uniref:Uncharacterized protein n=1 Tax=Ilumatobacter coccineus (strain NBRC 103263 / KCTC 29153 / YM16-304) TaxID=1313172 RepID=A0A6C7E9Z6_ILUCY|nr:hypothetical protein [Ilumatobacter coccineus]BAN03281.1 hypothetical protein YM304_29670 [Ilumatobacter coccineus YM16-304]
MKTRTLLLLSVGTALAILLAGGVLLFQLSGQQDAVEPSQVGDEVVVGDLSITVLSASESSDFFSVEVTLAGVDDPSTDSIRLVTGDGRLEATSLPAEGRCTTITVEAQTCTLDFGLEGVASTNRTLIVRRGDEQANWNLAS